MFQDIDDLFHKKFVIFQDYNFRQTFEFFIMPFGNKTSCVGHTKREGQKVIQGYVVEKNHNFDTDDYIESSTKKDIENLLCQGFDEKNAIQKLAEKNILIVLERMLNIESNRYNIDVSQSLREYQEKGTISPFQERKEFLEEMKRKVILCKLKNSLNEFSNCLMPEKTQKNYQNVIFNFENLEDSISSTFSIPEYYVRLQV